MNYKTGFRTSDAIVQVDIGGLLIAMKPDITIISLINVASGTKTYHDMRDNTDYQVPTGKKARIIYIINAPMSGASDLIFYADNADGTTNQVTLYDPSSAVTNTIFISASIPADKYVNYVDDSGSGSIVILEENA